MLARVAIGEGFHFVTTAQVHLATNTHYAPTGIVEGTFVPLLPSIEAVMARPQNVQTLMAAAQTHTCITNFNQSALSYLRDVTRGGKGLPHVVEWTNERLPLEVTYDMYSRPFIIGGVAWVLSVRSWPHMDKDSGWWFFMQPVFLSSWDTSDFVQVTVEVSMPYGGEGYATQEGLNLTFSLSRRVQQGPFHLLALLPYKVVPGAVGNGMCGCQVVALGAGNLGTAATAWCQGHSIHGHGHGHSHTLRLHFTRVVTSWGQEDDGRQPHAEAQFHRTCKQHLELLHLAKACGVQQQFCTAVQHRVHRKGSGAMYNEYLWAGHVYEGASGQAKLLSSLVADNMKCIVPSRPVAPNKVKAVLAMAALKIGHATRAQRSLVQVIAQPSQRTLYMDRSDGDMLLKYSKECTARSSRTQPGRPGGVCANEASHDTLFDPAASSATGHLERAMSFWDGVWRTAKVESNQALRHQLLDAPYNRQALLGSVNVTSVHKDVRSCITRLPPQGPVQVFEWQVRLAQNTIFNTESTPFAACGLTWRLARVVEAGLRMVLEPLGDLHHDIMAVRGTARYELLARQRQGTKLLASTHGNGSFVVNAKSPNITLWRLPKADDPVTLQLQHAVLDSGLLRLYINASVEWRGDAKGHVAAVHEVIQQQYLLATAAHHLGVGQRFAKTVRIETKVDDGGRPRAWMAVQRQDKTYTLDDVHVLLDELVQGNLRCHTRSMDIATTKRSAVFDMAALHAGLHVGRDRARVAPKVVVLHPEHGGHPAAATASPRYLDEYGHDVTPYLSECTTDLEGLQYSIAFGEDIEDDGSMGACSEHIVTKVARPLMMVSTVANVAAMVFCCCAYGGRIAAFAWMLTGQVIRWARTLPIRGWIASITAAAGRARGIRGMQGAAGGQQQEEQQGQWQQQEQQPQQAEQQQEPQQQGQQQAALADTAYDGSLCLVCHDGLREWGFLHRDSVHMGVCGECKEELERRRGSWWGTTCIVCKQQLDGFIRLHNV